MLVKHSLIAVWTSVYSLDSPNRWRACHSREAPHVHVDTMNRHLVLVFRGILHSTCGG